MKFTIRKAFRMAVHPENVQEYVRRHQPIWPELARVLQDHGAHNYSIFLDESTSELFAYVEIEDEARWNAVAETEVCQRWWAEMSALMPSWPDNRPIAQDLVEVFHLP